MNHAGKKIRNLGGFVVPAIFGSVPKCIELYPRCSRRSASERGDGRARGRSREAGLNVDTLQKCKTHAGVPLEAECGERPGVLRVRDSPAHHHRQRPGAAGTTRPRGHRGGGAVLLPSERAFPQLPDRGCRGPHAHLPDVLRSAVPQGAGEAPRQEGSIASVDEPGDAELRGPGAGRVAPGHAVPGGVLRAGDGAIQGLHAAVPRGAGQPPVRPGVPRRWVEEQALDALQQEKVHGQRDALISCRCLLSRRRG